MIYIYMVIFGGQSVNCLKFIFRNILQFFNLPVQHGFECDMRCSSFNCQINMLCLCYVTSSIIKSLKKYLSTQAMKRNFQTIINPYGRYHYEKVKSEQINTFFCFRDNHFYSSGWSSVVIDQFRFCAVVKSSF